MLQRFQLEVDAIPCPVPRRPKSEPSNVVEEVSVLRVSPIDDRGDSAARDQHVEVQQITVDQMAIFGDLVHKRLKAANGLLERSDARGRQRSTETSSTTLLGSLFGRL